MSQELTPFESIRRTFWSFGLRAGLWMLKEGECHGHFLVARSAVYQNLLPFSRKWAALRLAAFEEGGLGARGSGNGLG